MQKERSNYKVTFLLIIALLIFSGCQVSTPGELGETTLADEMAKVAQTEGLDSDSGRSVSKEVTVTKIKIYTNRIYPIKRTLIMADMGLLSMSYDDGEYKGVLRSTGATILSSYRWYRVKVTYKGTVYKPSTKTVTVSEIEKYTGSTNMISEVFRKARAGDYSKSFNDGEYKGTLRSTDCTTMELPIPAGGDDAIFTVRITYEGVVTEILP